MLLRKTQRSIRLLTYFGDVCQGRNLESEYCINPRKLILKINVENMKLEK